jgi:hypothetical protein
MPRRDKVMGAGTGGTDRDDRSSHSAAKAKVGWKDGDYYLLIENSRGKIGRADRCTSPAVPRPAGTCPSRVSTSFLSRAKTISDSPEGRPM